MKYIEFKEISLDSDEFKYAFSPNAKIMLNNIKTLEDLFIASDEKDFYKTSDNSEIYNNTKLEIIKTTKLLRCKYLKENPNINIFDYLELIKIFNARLTNALRRNLRKNCDHTNLSSRDLFDAAKNDDYNIFNHMRNLGNVSLEELKFKMKIIYDYYNEQFYSECMLPEDELYIEIKNLNINETQKNKMLKLLNEIKENKKDKIM